MQNLNVQMILYLLNYMTILTNGLSYKNKHNEIKRTNTCLIESFFLLSCYTNIMEGFSLSCGDGHDSDSNTVIYTKTQSNTKQGTISN